MKSKTKKLLGVLLTACLAVCVCLAVAACGDYPAFKNPLAVETDEKGYTINVKSAGGLPLSDVLVTAKQNGTEVAKGISSANGAVYFRDLEPGVYELTYSGLPRGYEACPDTAVRTKADEHVVDSYFLSSVIDQTAPSDTSYGVGMVMYNFEWMDSENTVHNLAETLEYKKAVIFNFWFQSCGPCRSEFPFLNSAYQTYRNDLEIFAFSTLDTMSVVRQYRADLALTFPMGPDSLGLANMFGFTTAPVTVVIDRYGIIAEIHRGSVTSEGAFNAIFRKYTSDNYTQTTPEVQQGGTSGSMEYAKRPATLSTPSSADFAAALNGANIQATYNFNVTERDRDITWPWEIANGEDNIPYASPTNCGTDFSLSALYMQLTLSRGDIFSFECNYKTEITDTGYGGDILYVSINGDTPVIEIQGDSDGKWESYSFSPSMRDETIEVVFFYLKDDGESEENEFVGIRNLSVINAKDAPFTDLLYEAASGYDEAQKDYDTYAKVKLLDDGYYHVVTEGEPEADWPILLVDLLTADSPWRIAHHDGETFTFGFPGDQTAASWPASVYHISFCYYGNNAHDRINYAKGTVNDDDQIVADDTYVLFENYWMQTLNTQTNLVPVDKYLHDLLVKFCEAESHRLNYTLSDDTWLELCYYYRHTSNDDKHDSTHACFERINPVKGWSTLNAYKIAPEAADFENGKTYSTHVSTTYPRQTHPGMRYLFKAPTAGVYRIYSKDPLGGVDPYLYIRTTALSDDNVYLGEVDDYRRYDIYVNETYGTNFETFYYFEKAGDEVILQCALQSTGLGEYDLCIEYMGASYELFYVATTAGGAFTTDEDGSNLRYLAVEAQLGTNDTWYPVQNNEVSTKPMYIDFIHPTYATGGQASIEEAIQAGAFNFTGRGGEDYTAAMRRYLEEAKEGKEEDNELYGMHVATGDLVDILTTYLQMWDDNYFGNAQGYWESFACYYAHFGPMF